MAHAYPTHPPLTFSLNGSPPIVAPACRACRVSCTTCLGPAGRTLCPPPGPPPPLTGPCWASLVSEVQPEAVHRASDRLGGLRPALAIGRFSPARSKREEFQRHSGLGLQLRACCVLAPAPSCDPRLEHICVHHSRSHPHLADYSSSVGDFVTTHDLANLTAISNLKVGRQLASAWAFAAHTAAVDAHACHASRCAALVGGNKGLGAARDPCYRKEKSKI